MKKILYVTTISNTVNAFLIPHISMLVNKGCKVDVAFNIANEVNPELYSLGCRVYNIKFQRSPLNKNNFLAYRQIKKLITNEKYDLIHTHTPVASLLVRMACRNIDDVTIFYTAHGFHFYKGAPIKNWLIYYPIENIVSRWTDGLITMNSEDYSSAKGMKLRKKDSVYKINGVGIDLSEFSKPTVEEKKKLRKQYKFSNNDFILFYAAELNKNKHQDLLIDAVSLLRNKIPNIKLLLAGKGNLRQVYNKKINELNLEDHIKMIGHRKDIKNLLKITDIGIASSRREGLPVNIMEAMATGLPLVVTDVRGHRDLVMNNRNGFTVDIEDTNSFANSIEKIYKSPKLKEQFGNKNIKLIKKYSVENVLQNMMEIYQENIK